MKVIILGAGEVGLNTGSKLSQEGHEVVLIERSPERIQRVKDQLDVQAILGSGTSPSVLKEAGIQDAQLFLAATDSDEVNLLACLLAKNLNPHVTRVARVRNEELEDPSVLGKDHMGIDFIINPGKAMVQNIINILEHPWAVDISFIAGGRLKLVEVKIENDSPLAGKRLKELVQYRGRILIGAILRGQKVIIPRGDDNIQEGDSIYFISHGYDESILEWIRPKEPPYARRVIVVGAGDVGTSLTKELDKSRFEAKIIEKDRTKCHALAMGLNKVMVIEGDATDRDLLQEEEVDKTDFIVALTNDEENNILVALLAKALGTKKAIVRINRVSYMSLVSSIGIDIVVSSRLAAAKAILSFIRKGKVLSVTPLGAEDAEVIEAEAVENSPIVYKALKDLKFPTDALVGAIVRKNEVIIPKGDTQIMPKDKLVIFALESAVNKVEGLLSSE